MGSNPASARLQIFELWVQTLLCKLTQGLYKFCMFHLEIFQSFYHNESEDDVEWVPGVPSIRKDAFGTHNF